MEFSNLNIFYYNDLISNIKIDNKLFFIPEQDSIAYIMFTSGSTGKPKGVKISYNNINNLIHSLFVNIYNNKKKHMRLAVLAPFTFDASVKQIFYSLTQGHSLYIVDDKTKKYGRLLTKYFNQNQIMVSDITPTLIDIIYQDKSLTPYYGLEKLLVGGEILEGNHINKIHELFGKCLEVTNLYGPTECCVDTTYFKISNQTKYLCHEKISVGKPLLNVYISITENNEVVISGNGVGEGYIGINQEGFYIDSQGNKCYMSGDIGRFDDDNNLYILGRIDNQIKLRGYRVDLDEVNAIILDYCNAEYSYTIYNKGIIISFVKSEDRNANKLKQKLKAILPDYMIPKIIYFIDRIIYNNNGKLDTKYYMNYLNSYNE